LPGRNRQDAAPGYVVMGHFTTFLRSHWSHRDKVGPLGACKLAGSAFSHEFSSATGTAVLFGGYTEPRLGSRHLQDDTWTWG